MFLGGPQHCAAQLAGSPAAAAHLRSIAAALQLGSSWLPLGTATAAHPADPQHLCIAIHAWLLACLAYGLPAVLLHGSEARQRRFPLQQLEPPPAEVVAAMPPRLPDSAAPMSGAADRTSVEDFAAREAAPSGAEASGGPRELEAEASALDDLRRMLLPNRQPPGQMCGELALSAYVAWLLVQATLPWLDMPL